MERLAHEIREYGFKGVLLARVHPDDSQNFQLVYGHRRREAAKLAGLQTLPVMIDNTINDHEMKFLALNENILRDDLTPIDEGYSFAAMLVEMSQDAVAARMGVSRGYIRNRVDILKAPEDVQDMVEEKPDTMKAVVYLKDVQEDDIRTTVIQALMNEEVTINQIKVLIENLRQAKSTPSMAREEPVPSSHTQNGKDEQHQTEDIQSEKERTRTPTTHLIEQSKEQTEAATDKTKIQTFIKYLNKYNGRLDSRQMTPDEHAALCTLADVVQGILVRHS
ncbi:MAG: ParB/RepB/Spo0J family partition protein [Chloroflexi bacterium]|nr:MAG: ParB/RepB/Spo0J family partition protein [Chloroflexota bacterium]